MTAALPRYALVSFEHMGRSVIEGEALTLHDELVELRPDLFTTDPPAKKSPRRKAEKEES